MNGGGVLSHDLVAAIIASPPMSQDERTLLEGVREAADRHDIAFLVADDLDLAAALMADGAEIDWAEDAFASAQARLGEGRSVGCRVGASRHQAMQAAEMGADYVRFAPQGSERGDIEAMLELCEWWAEIFEIACIADGISEGEDLARLWRAGVEFVAIDDETAGTVLDFLSFLAAEEDATHR